MKNKEINIFASFFGKEDAAMFMACLPHYKYFNDPRIVTADQVNLDQPDEEKAEWIAFHCRFWTVDGFHRKGVSLGVPFQC